MSAESISASAPRALPRISLAMGCRVSGSDGPFFRIGCTGHSAGRCSLARDLRSGNFSGAGGIRKQIAMSEMYLDCCV